jgi:hypothetical protein
MNQLIKEARERAAHQQHKPGKQTLPTQLTEACHPFPDKRQLLRQHYLTSIHV